MSEFTPELGQWGWSNSPWQEIESPEWMVDGLEEIATAIATGRGHVPDEYGYEQLLTSNWGEEPFEVESFAMRTYCWCDGSKTDHQQGCLPNFEHKASGLIINWYKHCGRGRSQNKEITRQEWQEIVRDCLNGVVSIRPQEQ